MRKALLVAAVIGAGLGPALAEGGPRAAATTGSTAAAAGEDKAAAVKDKDAARRAAKEAIAECMRLWDAATHMTRQEWARTCARIQSRLENLRLENLDMSGPSPARARKGGSRQQGSDDRSSSGG